jgi:FixJ family two-component response regulator
VGDSPSWSGHNPRVFYPGRSTWGTSLSKGDLAPGEILVIDDDESVRKALSRLIGSAGYVVESFSSAEALLNHARVDRAECIVVDLRMPGMDGLQLQEELSRAAPLASIVFITGHGDVSATVQAMKAGAIDFLEKPFTDSALLEAIRAGLAKSRESRSERAELMELEGRFSVLTARERQVFALVTTGLLNKQVGAELGTTERTIKVHRGRVMKKMRADSLADLVRMASRLQIPAPNR